MNRSPYRSPKQTLLVNLRKILAERFGEVELHMLGLDMFEDYEPLQGSGKMVKAIELVSRCDRRDIIAQLVSRVLDRRPDVLSDLLSEGVFSPIEDTDRIPFSALDGDIYFFDIHRCEMTTYYIRWAEAASRVDIITMSMGALLENYGDARLIKWLIEGKVFRVLVLSPGSAAAKVRGKEEGISVPDKIVTQIETLNCVYERARKQIVDEGQKCPGSLEVRLYDGNPYFAYFGTEREIIIGLYYAQKKGLQSEVFLVNVRSQVYKDFESHFNTLWDGRVRGGMPLEDRLVCVISASSWHFMDVNKLRETIARQEGVHHGNLDR